MLWHSRCLSLRGQGVDDGALPPRLLLLPRPDQWTVHEYRVRSVGCCVRATATEDISCLFAPNRRNCSHPKSHAVSCLTVLPTSGGGGVFRLRINCTGSGHISAGSTSHGNLSLIKFFVQVFLPYLQLRQTALLDSPVPLWPTCLETLAGGGGGVCGEDELAFPVNQQRGSSSGNRSRWL